MHKQALQAMAEKLEQTAKHNQLERRQEREEAELRLAAMDGTLKERRKRDIEELSALRQSVKTLSVFTEQVEKGFLLRSEREEQTLTRLKQDTEAMFEAERTGHQERIQTLVEGYEQQASQINHESNLKTKAQRDKTEQALRALSNNVYLVQQRLTEETEQRVVNCGRIQRDLSDELKGLRLEMDRQEERRLQAHKDLIGMMDEATDKVTSEVANQQQKRKRNNEQLLRLIDVVCTKLEEIMS